MATRKETKAPTKTKKTYEAIAFAQRIDANAPKLVMFNAPAGEITQWAGVDQLSPTTKGPQREKREARVEAIRKFFISDENNTIPTALIVAFSKNRSSFTKTKASEGLGTLTVKLDSSSKAATIVDGQHRLFGAKDFNPKTRLAVVALLDADEVEKAFQFLVINNKASKVPATHTKALLAKLKATKLNDRLKGARLAFDEEGINDVDLINSDKDSPFYQTIDWPSTPKGKRKVQATAIEISLDYLGGLGISDFSDRDVRRSIFLSIWKVIKEKWGDLFKADSRLISKVGIVCLTRFIADRITNWADSDELEIVITDLDQIEEQTKKIINYMDKRFWTNPWAEKAQGGFDTNQGRDRVVAAITMLYRNGRRDLPWYSDIEIIERASAKN